MALIRSPTLREKLRAGFASALDFGKPAFDMVEPGRTGRSEVDVITRLVPPHGMLVLLENVRDFEARFVFPHNADWVEMVERAASDVANGAPTTSCFQMVGAIRAAAHSLRGEAVTRLETGSSFRKRIHSLSTLLWRCRLFHWNGAVTKRPSRTA